MMVEQTENPKGRRRGLWFWRILVGLLVLAVAGLLIMRWHWRAGFYQRVEALRAAGYPTTPQELDAWYPWPQSGKNAADWILGAATYYREPQGDDLTALQSIINPGKDKSLYVSPLPPDQRELLTTHIQNNAKVLSLLHEATAIAECRYPAGIPTGQLPHLPELRKLARLLCFDAALRVEENDPAGAVRDIREIFLLTDSLQNEPMLVSQLSRMGQQGLALSALERALSRMVLPDAQLRELGEIVSRAYKPQGMIRGLVGERCWMAHLLENPIKVDRAQCADIAPLPVIEAYRGLGLLHREGAAYIDFMTVCLDAMKLPPHQRQKAVDAAQAQILSKMHGCLFLRNVMPSTRVLILDLRALARIQAATVAIAVERYRLANARLPDRLEQLAPVYLESIPDDPFDGKPLRYSPLDRGFVIYSVGEDRRDDGGRERPVKGGAGPDNSCDLPFTVGR